MKNQAIRDASDELIEFIKKETSDILLDAYPVRLLQVAPNKMVIIHVPPEKAEQFLKILKKGLEKND